MSSMTAAPVPEPATSSCSVLAAPCWQLGLAWRD
jgi:hypothetical protein